MASVTMMADSGLPCFGYKEPLRALEARFHMEMTDVEAAKFMRETVDDAYDKVWDGESGVCGHLYVSQPPTYNAVDYGVL